MADNCTHDLVYIVDNGKASGSRKGSCIRCSELIDISTNYVEHKNLRWVVNGASIPVYAYEKSDQHYSVMAKPGADMNALSEYLRKYGSVHSDDGLPLLSVRCSEKKGEQLKADHKKKIPPLDSILMMTKHS